MQYISNQDKFAGIVQYHSQVTKHFNALRVENIYYLIYCIYC